MMLGGVSAEEKEAGQQMANAQVISSVIQFTFAVGLMNLGSCRS